MVRRVFNNRGGPTSGLTQPQVDARIRALAQAKVDPYADLAAAEAAHTWPVPAAEGTRVESLTDGTLLVAAPGDNGFTPVAGAAAAPTEFGAATATTDGTAGTVHAPTAGQQDLVLHGDKRWRELIPNWTADRDYSTGAIVFQADGIYRRKARGKSELFWNADEQAEWTRLADETVAANPPVYAAVDILGAGAAGDEPPGIYDPAELAAWWINTANGLQVIYNHQPAGIYQRGRLVIGADRRIYEALVDNPTEVPTDAGQTEWAAVDLVPTPDADDNGRILRVVNGEYALVDETPSSPLIQPTTPYTTGETVSALWPVAEGGDGTYHRFLSLQNRTSTAVPAGEMTAAEYAAGANWQDLGASTAMVGATATVDGAGGEVPAPAAGNHLDTLTGAATWDYRPRYLGEVADFAALLALPDAQPGDEVHVQTAGANQRGATYKRLRIAANSLADWIKTAEITNPATIDDTTTTIDTTTFDASVTA